LAVNDAEKIDGFHLRPHDLRRHAAIDASRSGIAIQIVSKLIRHANLSTTQQWPHPCPKALTHDMIRTLKAIRRKQA
jgi:site-specific recombinase XerD